MVTRFESGNNTLRREKLLNEITQRHVHHCPMLALLPRMSTDHIVTEKPIDAPFDPDDDIRNISDPHGTAKLEGDEFVDRDADQPQKLRYITEIKSESFKMTGSNMPVVAAGMSSTWDYESGKMMIRKLNDWDNTSLFGMGGPEIAGTTIPRKAQGLMSWAFVTGLERVHGDGTLDTITDPYGVSIARKYWSVAYNANHSNLTPDMMYNQLIIPLGNAGAVLSPAWIAMCGDRMAGRVARFNEPGGGIKIEEKTRPADAGIVADYVRWFKFPNGVVVGFVTNKWMDRPDQQFEFGSNFTTTPGTPATPGSVDPITFDGDASLVMWEPGAPHHMFYRDPAYRLLPTSKDESRLGCLLEATLFMPHPLCVGAIGNALG